MINNLIKKTPNFFNLNKFRFFKEWGGVLLFLSLCLFARAQAASFRSDQTGQLTEKMTHLVKVKQEKQRLLSYTKLKLQSMSDPEMIKMLLIKELGLVQEDQIKVIFQDSGP